jgi:hypothetical protein
MMLDIRMMEVQNFHSGYEVLGLEDQNFHKGIVDFDKLDYLE